jgi:hypothetical protein
LYDKTNVNNKWVELINNIPEVSIQW